MGSLSQDLLSRALFTCLISLFIRSISAETYKDWWAVPTLQSIDPVYIRSVRLCNLVVAISCNDMVL